MARIGKAIAGRLDPGGDGEAEMWNASGVALMRGGAHAVVASAHPRIAEILLAMAEVAAADGDLEAAREHAT